jgi:hypothetical protein
LQPRGDGGLGRDIVMKQPIGVIFILLEIAILAGGCNKTATRTSGGSSSSARSDNAAQVQSATPPSQSDRDAIVDAIQKHLANNKGINMAAMDMSVDSVAVNGDQAQANAAFRLKQGGTGMMMTYFLERHANGWLVMHSQPADGQFVHPPMDKTHSGVAPSAGQPQVPDVTDFLKKQAPARTGSDSH